MDPNIAHPFCEPDGPLECRWRWIATLPRELEFIEPATASQVQHHHLTKEPSSV
ncbi:hypothetical protein [Nonomuraea jabiensis]|uniref:Uncharacterized protein n=1 Tax=Nonomuraea jabiensis TaxID=882448 RepID=A0A7W9LB70_9ACTN|nr:hypothetical protein [Nonomuraea jabiensis]MBB5777400.1 hypothetical protein [Nonomuraea jabiensis]